jgi:hypothetical protein
MTTPDFNERPGECPSPRMTEEGKRNLEMGRLREEHTDLMDRIALLENRLRETEEALTEKAEYADLLEAKLLKAYDEVFPYLVADRDAER